MNWIYKRLENMYKRLGKSKDNAKKNIEKTKTDKIEDAIIKGMAAKSIANKYNSSISYVYKVKSDMKKGGKI